MKPKTKRKLRRIFSFYHIAIFLCIVISLVSILAFFGKDIGNIPNPFVTKYKIVNDVKVYESGVKENQDIDESKAKKVAVRQFKELGEKDIKEADLKIQKIQRKGVEYYYVTSSKNTMEIRIKGGVVSRINAVVVE